MHFPPIKSDRALLWITLQPDSTAAGRYRALHEVLRACHLHPLDSTSSSALVIVEEAAFRARLETVRAALGPGDVLHLVAAPAGRLAVEAIAGNPTAVEPMAQRPPWFTS